MERKGPFATTSFKKGGGLIFKGGPIFGTIQTPAVKLEIFPALLWKISERYTDAMTARVTMRTVSLFLLLEQLTTSYTKTSSLVMTHTVPSDISFYIQT